MGGHAFGVRVPLRGVGLVREHIELELQRVLAGGVRQLVEEALEHECKGVAAGRPQCAHRHALGK